ncbi:MAG TPA: hydantoinase/oxoprolinase family protein [Acidimicrobiales bacterium]|nr:hydantoinase/oxoprolinase family protein [Acidimicrobiales bacterium]
MTERRCFLGVDVGGTFTDVVLGDSDGRVAFAKVTTTPADPRDGVAAGIERILTDHSVRPEQVARLVHGTTLSTNVILEQRGADVAFITTRGFGDMARLGREFRQEDERFNLSFRPPPPPVPRHRTFEVRERVDARGQVLLAPTADDLDDVARQVAATGAGAVAVCLLNAYANPAHERLVADACRVALGESAFVVTSSEVWPELREYERAMTTIMCATVGPVMAGYLAGLGRRLAQMGLRCPIEIMDSSGGVMSAERAARRPIYTVESGGAAGVIAAGFIGGLTGDSEILSFDMGGTTAKTAVVRGGRPAITHDFHVGGASSGGGHRRSDGYPVKIPVVDVAEVGAGGGSIATVDSGGGLHVGPRSSGSVPGPACYARGGTDATVTDANLLLGYLHAGDLSGGVRLSRELAEEAVRAHVAVPLGLDVISAARAVHDVANATMAAALRVVTVQRGVDPRAFALIAFGGAGPMHAAELASTFGIGRVVIPRAAGVASALGLITADLVVDRVRTWIVALETCDPAALDRAFTDLEQDAASELPVGSGELAFARMADVRYRGQAHQLTVPAPSGPATVAALEAIGTAFAEEYRRAYGVDGSGPTELVNLRVRALRKVEKLVPVAASRAEGPAPLPASRRGVCFAGSAFTDVPVFAWDSARPGDRLAGPLVVEGSDTSVVVPPGFDVEVDSWCNLALLARDG